MYFEIPCQSLGYVRPTMCLAPKTYLRRTLSYLHCILWIWATLLWRPCSPRLSPCPSIYTKPHFRRQCTACGPIPELETAMRKQNRANSWAVAYDCGHHTSLKKQITSRSFFPLHHAPHKFLRHVVTFPFVLYWFCDATTDGHLLKHLEDPWSIVSSTWHRFHGACSVLAASFRFIFGISFEALQYFNQFFQLFVLAALFSLSFWVTDKSEGQLQSVWATFMMVLGLFLSTLVISST